MLKQNDDFKLPWEVPLRIDIFRELRVDFKLKLPFCTSLMYAFLKSSGNSYISRHFSVTMLIESNAS